MLAGRYELVEQLHDGPALWRAISHGAAGFTLPVAVQELPAANVARFVGATGTALVHPNIVQIYDLCRDADRHYLVTEWVDGVSIAQLLRAMKHLRMRPPWPLIAVMGIGALRGLEAAHEHQGRSGRATFVQSHLTPHSVFVSSLGVTKLTPFGERPRRADDPHYRAPELAKQAASPRSDLYALGALLWEALTGAPPFEVDEELLGLDDGCATTLAAARADIPRRMRAAIERAIAYAPADRFTSATAMAAELAAAVAAYRWQHGPRLDVGHAVVEAQHVLAHLDEEHADPDLEVVPEGDVLNPILLTRLAAEPLDDPDLEVVPEGAALNPILLTRRVAPLSEDDLEIVDDE